jgi:hypothetical protein
VTPGARASRAYTMHHRRLEVDRLRPSIPGSETLPGSPGCHQLKPATYVPCGMASYHPSAIARCKMIISAREPRYNLAERGMLLTVDPTYPNAWRRKLYYVRLLEWAQHMVVEIG